VSSTSSSPTGFEWQAELRPGQLLHQLVELAEPALDATNASAYTAIQRFPLVE